MFLKNDSIYKVGLRTVKGDLEVKPQEIIHIIEDELLDISEHLITVKEQEYEEYINSCGSIEDINEDKLIGHPESCKPCFEDEKTPLDKDCLKCKEEKLKKELDEINSQDVIPTKEDTNTEALNPNNIAEGLADKTKKLIEDDKESIITKLKKQWEEAKKPAEKAKIAKELKKLEGR